MEIALLDGGGGKNWTVREGGNVIIRIFNGGPLGGAAKKRCAEIMSPMGDTGGLLLPVEATVSWLLSYTNSKLSLKNIGAPERAKRPSDPAFSKDAEISCEMNLARTIQEDRLRFLMYRER